MKTLAAITATLTLLWAQCVAGLTPAGSGVTAQPPSACACADCHGGCCCVQTPAPGAPTTPVAPQRSGAKDVSAIPTAPSLAWQLPETGRRGDTAYADSLLSSTDVPLFSRHCARLL